MIKAIETRYNGYRFRSRLEARWALFFDTLHISYDYELEGFELSVRYLPDFYIPEWDKFVEIKPRTKRSQKEIIKAGTLCQKSEKIVLLISGNPWPGEYQIFPFVPILNTEKKIVAGIPNGNTFCVFAYGVDHENMYLAEFPKVVWDDPFSAEQYSKELKPLGCDWVFEETENGIGGFYALEERHINKGVLLENVHIIIGKPPEIGNESLLSAAFVAARQARFEHGETPKGPRV